MDRTESLVVQVAPAFENQKIAEMEMFGWNLQGRQEIHEAGDAYGAPSFFDSNTYVIKQRVSKYVKLHFARSLSLPSLDEIRQIESEYFNLPFPAPPSQTGPVGCIAVSALWLACVVCAVLPFLLMIPEAMRTSRIVDTLGAFVIIIGGNAMIGVAALVPGVYWYRSNERRKKESMQVCEQSASRAKELVAELKPLLVQ